MVILLHVSDRGPDSWQIPPGHEYVLNVNHPCMIKQIRSTLALTFTHTRAIIFIYSISVKVGRQKGAYTKYYPVAVR